MAVRLGTQNWINPAPFAAAAEMVVDAGRATGAGIAAIGAGIGQGLQNRQARQERAQNRQDALDQRSFENDRALRAEDRAVKQSKLAASESILAAKKMNLDMASKMYESMGTPESEAAMLKAQQDFQEANNWYQVSVGNNADIQPPQGGVTDYLGVGGSSGVSVGGRPMSQMTDAELNDLMAKSERGEVDYTYRGGATGDMGQGVGNVAPSPRQPSMEAAAELTTAAGFALAATNKRKEAVGVLAKGKTHANKALADYLNLEAQFLEFQAQMKRNDEVSAREATEKRAEEARKSSEDKAAIAALRADLENRGIKETLPDDLATARQNYNNFVIKDPDSAAAAARKESAAKTRADNQKALVDYRARASMALADHMAKIKEPAERAKAMQGAIENQQKLVKSLKDEYDLLKTLQGKGLVGEDDPDIVGGPNRPSAYERYEAERNVLMDMMKQAPEAAPAAAGGRDPMTSAEEEYNRLPDAEKTPEAAARIAAKYGIK